MITKATLQRENKRQVHHLFRAIKAYPFPVNVLGVLGTVSGCFKHHWELEVKLV